MTDTNKRNLMYFEAATMRDLYRQMEEWQATHEKRLLSASIQRDGAAFCCIAASNPTEVVICSGSGANQAAVSQACLEIKQIY